MVDCDCEESSDSSLSLPFNGVVGADVEGFTGSLVSSPPVFNNSENDFCGPTNAPNPLEVPLKALKAPLVGAILAGVGEAGVLGAKTDLGPPSADGVPNVGVVAD